MKKTKLLTSLTALGLISVAAPIIATSCSETNKIVSGETDCCTIYETETGCLISTWSSQLEGTVTFKLSKDVEGAKWSLEYPKKTAYDIKISNNGILEIPLGFMGVEPVTIIAKDGNNNEIAKLVAIITTEPYTISYEFNTDDGAQYYWVDLSRTITIPKDARTGELTIKCESAYQSDIQKATPYILNALPEWITLEKDNKEFNIDYTKLPVIKEGEEYPLIFTFIVYWKDAMDIEFHSAFHVVLDVE